MVRQWIIPIKKTDGSLRTFSDHAEHLYDKRYHDKEQSKVHKPVTGNNACKVHGGSVRRDTIEDCYDFVFCHSLDVFQQLLVFPLEPVLGQLFEYTRFGNEKGNHG